MTGCGQNAAQPEAATPNSFTSLCLQCTSNSEPQLQNGVLAVSILTSDLFENYFSRLPEKGREGIEFVMNDTDKEHEGGRGRRETRKSEKDQVWLIYYKHV